MPKIPQTLALATVFAAAVTSVSLGFTNWEQETPGTRHFIRPEDIAPPTGPSTVNIPSVVPRPADAVPQVPAGFKVELFAGGLDGPRTIRVAPNGDIFVVESRAGRIHVFRTADKNDAPVTESIFASNLNLPSGLAFAPPGPNPEYVYVADTDAVLRFPYHNGDLQAAGPAEVVIPSLPVGGHWTRDIAFSPQGDRLFIAIGSRSNDAEDLSPRSPEEIRAFEATHGLGATWDDEEGRALIAVYDLQSRSLKPFATGLRNCIGLAIHPQAQDLWCTNDERDEFGDNAMPDFVTRIKQGAFYGWPFTYLGGREDPRHKGQRPELAERTTMPDVLLQPHSAPLAITFYDADHFPPEYRGDAFVALHGSYNRSRRTGYKVVRLFLKNGVPTGEYEDFMTGFVVSDEAVWGRPAGVAVARDGALLVSEDAGGTVWRVSRAPLREAAEH
ncbi:MAG: sorbosone dehydrogenase family protein [Acetobacteraceae bacterium]|nr:sorbosone dehydrogenase family protein [Acetobacteraceae bacterium]